MLTWLVMNALKHYSVRGQWINRTKGQRIKPLLTINLALLFYKTLSTAIGTYCLCEASALCWGYRAPGKKEVFWAPKTITTEKSKSKQKKKIPICPLVRESECMKTADASAFEDRITGKVCTWSHGWNHKKLCRWELNGTIRDVQGSVDETHLSSARSWHCHSFSQTHP